MAKELLVLKMIADNTYEIYVTQPGNTVKILVRIHGQLPDAIRKFNEYEIAFTKPKYPIVIKTVII